MTIEDFNKTWEIVARKENKHSKPFCYDWQTEEWTAVLMDYAKMLTNKKTGKRYTVIGYNNTVEEE